jgi:hypothetical protein
MGLERAQTYYPTETNLFQTIKSGKDTAISLQQESGTPRKASTYQESSQISSATYSSSSPAHTPAPASSSGGYWVTQHYLGHGYTEGNQNEFANVTGPNLEIYVIEAPYRYLAGANIYLDGKYVGTTGTDVNGNDNSNNMYNMLSIRNLEDRPYDLKIELPGYHLDKGLAEKNGHFSSESYTGIFDPSKNIPWTGTAWYYSCSEKFGNPVTFNQHMKTCTGAMYMAKDTASASSGSVSDGRSTTEQSSGSSKSATTSTQSSPLSPIIVVISIVFIAGCAVYPHVKK